MALSALRLASVPNVPKHLYPACKKHVQMRNLSDRCHGASTDKFIKGKVALVTGSTSGIGLGMARSLALRGANVILNGFGDRALIDSIKTDFEMNYGVTCDYYDVDLTSQPDVEKFTKTVQSAYASGVDILVNNAGFQHVSKVQDFPVEQWNALLAVLLSSPFLLIRSFLPMMLEKKWGRIINLASVHSLKASPFKAAYCSAKHGVAGLTKVVALETAGTGVTCNAISPGYVETSVLEMQVKTLAEKEAISYDEAKERFLSSFHPSKRAVGVEQLGEMCVFLCSNAATEITGSNFVMDGGWNAK